MSKKQHQSGGPQISANQNNKKSSGDLGAGNRTSLTVGKDGSTPLGKATPDDAQNPSTIEAFDEEGAGVAAKE